MKQIGFSLTFLFVAATFALPAQSAGSGYHPPYRKSEWSFSWFDGYGYEVDYRITSVESIHKCIDPAHEKTFINMFDQLVTIRHGRRRIVTTTFETRPLKDNVGISGLQMTCVQVHENELASSPFNETCDVGVVATAIKFPNCK